MRSRQTASCGSAYDDSGMVYLDVPMPDFIAEVAQ
jgi:hypothetical protein